MHSTDIAAMPSSRPSAPTPRDAMHPGRRTLLAAMVGAGAARPSIATAPLSASPVATMPPAPPRRSNAGAADVAEWRLFRSRYITGDGRVVDTGNGNVSHSEGQGFALLFAEWCDDRNCFERMLVWTQAHLARRGDALFAWCWRPFARVAVPDMNNATDGDLNIAWALQRAASRWGVPAWHELATTITADLLRLCTREIGDRTVLLPGAQGFNRPDGCVINPSYYNLAALRSLAQLVPGATLRRLESDGRHLLGAGRFGVWGLPPDWLNIDANSGRLSPAAGWPPRFSWDAVRVPLFLAWAGLRRHETVSAAASFWEGALPGTLPAWADLRSGALAPYAGHDGIRAVAMLAMAERAHTAQPLALPGIAHAGDYYAGALIMLSRMASSEAALGSDADHTLRLAE